VTCVGDIDKNHVISQVFSMKTMVFRVDDLITTFQPASPHSSLALIVYDQTAVGQKYYACDQEVLAQKKADVASPNRVETPPLPHLIIDEYEIKRNRRGDITLPVLPIMIWTASRHQGVSLEALNDMNS
jgi:hypothetical protein